LNSIRKLCLSRGSGGWSDPRPGRSDTSDLPPFQLYDLASDPGERTNLYEKHPERIEKMKAVMEDAIARGRTTPGPDLANDVPIELVKTVPARKNQ
jgi:arylsulfatase A